MKYHEALTRLEEKAAYVEKYAFAHNQNPDRTKLKHVTYLKRHRDDPEILVVELFEKDIMFYHPGGDIVLDSCGWRAVTTKQRFNEYLPREWRVWQEKGVWYISRHDINKPYWHDDTPKWVYDDNMILHADGTLDGHGGDPKIMRKLAKDINKYVRGYVSALLKGKVPAPSGGDCWYCGMVDKETNVLFGFNRSHHNEENDQVLDSSNGMEESDMGLNCLGDKNGGKKRKKANGEISNNRLAQIISEKF